MPNDIYNVLNSFIANVRINLAAGIKHTGKIKSHQNYLGPRQQSSIFLNSTDEFKVLEEIQNESSRKFSGLYGYPSRCI